MSDVKVGAIYADNDPRSAGRTLLIDAIDGDQAVCTVLTNSDEVQAYFDNTGPKPRWAPEDLKDRRGKQTRIRLARFAPTSTGYRLISEAS